MANHDDEEDEKKEGVVSDETLGAVLDEDADELAEPVAELPLEDEKAWE